MSTYLSISINYMEEKFYFTFNLIFNFFYK